MQLRRLVINMKFIRVVDGDKKPIKIKIVRIRKNGFIKYNGEYLMIPPHNILYNAHFPHRVVIIRKGELFTPHWTLSYPEVMKNV